MELFRADLTFRYVTLWSEGRLEFFGQYIYIYIYKIIRAADDSDFYCKICLCEVSDAAFSTLTCVVGLLDVSTSVSLLE